MGQEQGSSDREGQELVSFTSPPAKEVGALVSPRNPFRIEPQQQATTPPLPSAPLSQPQVNAGITTIPLASLAPPPAYFPASGGSSVGNPAFEKKTSCTAENPSPEQQQYAPTPAPYVLAYQAPAIPPASYRANGLAGHEQVVPQGAVLVTTVIHAVPVPLTLLGPAPAAVECPACKEHMVTSITYKVGHATQ
ncbi:hypothetical protein EST38_g10516 [Candolleomyces aberdarensis]|uniref:LITAF domain-containing protein n=1 Tax=Candolleomyces aberdarensis TaxID=2316362 RepID=A0A4V1Q2J8_9AGAR|nr:hypothetical protein EST38_g10516 [Candolleomyces aberdarensis]